MTAPQLNPQDYLREGRLSEAILALNQEVRRDPLDVKLRTFLFELLCFAGDFDRAEKQIEVISGGGQNAAVGALLYKSAIYASREREVFFESGTYRNQTAEPVEVSGTLNGVEFQRLCDADPRIGPRIEVMVAGRYMWVPFCHISSIEVQAPRRLRDLMWATATVKTSRAFEGIDLGEALMPVLSPAAWRDANDAVRLGRLTEWVEDDAGLHLPVGQKLLQTDTGEVPFLDVRKIEFHTPTSGRNSP